MFIKWKILCCDWFFVGVCPIPEFLLLAIKTLYVRSESNVMSFGYKIR